VRRRAFAAKRAQLDVLLRVVPRAASIVEEQTLHVRASVCVMRSYARAHTITMPVIVDDMRNAATTVGPSISCDVTPPISHTHQTLTHTHTHTPPPHAYTEELETKADDGGREHGEQARRDHLTQRRLGDNAERACVC
jgi:hypothetical protein